MDMRAPLVCACCAVRPECFRAVVCGRERSGVLCNCAHADRKSLQSQEVWILATGATNRIV
eukprot:10817551-Alexandrium_andersonii.AAC.1